MKKIRMVITTQNSKILRLKIIRYKPSEMFIHVTRERSKNIQVRSTQVMPMGKGVGLGAEVSKDAVAWK